MNISSIVVYTKPEHLEKVIESLKNSGVCEYHFHDEKGRIIVTIEGEGVSEELQKLKVIEELPFVISAQMQMSYSEEELDNHMKVLDSQEAVPKILQDDDIPVEEIVYHGDLKHKIDLVSFAKDFDKANK